MGRISKGVNMIFGAIFGYLMAGPLGFLVGAILGRLCERKDERDNGGGNDRAYWP